MATEGIFIVWASFLVCFDEVEGLVYNISESSHSTFHFRLLSLSLDVPQYTAKVFDICCIMYEHSEHFSKLYKPK